MSKWKSELEMENRDIAEILFGTPAKKVKKQYVQVYDNTEYKAYFRNEDGDLDSMDFPTWREMKKILNTVKIGDDIGFGYIEKWVRKDGYSEWEDFIILTTDKDNKVNQFVTWEQAKANQGLDNTGGN